jgi:hypothetical protein
MMLKQCCIVVTLFMVTSLGVMLQIVSAESNPTFREENGLQRYVPPGWFLKGYFIAREKNPSTLFGPVQDFVGSLGGKTTWLIEDLELERIHKAAADGKKIEYSLFLEVVSQDQRSYWVFVVLPYGNAQAWYDARRAYHGRKAAAYYGKTRSELAVAFEKGFKMTAELRFLIENGEVRPQTPEDVIESRHKYQPVFDLSTGRRLGKTARTE